MPLNRSLLIFQVLCRCSHDHKDGRRVLQPLRDGIWFRRENYEHNLPHNLKEYDV